MKDLFIKQNFKFPTFKLAKINDVLVGVWMMESLL